MRCSPSTRSGRWWTWSRRCAGGAIEVRAAPGACQGPNEGPTCLRKRVSTCGGADWARSGDPCRRERRAPSRLRGGSDAQAVTLDDDQSRSGPLPGTRAGFGRLVTAVARGEVGIVLSLELSRLSRNDPDWHHLVHLCRWTGTLIADEHGLYDPTSGPDRMVLGIRGHVGELGRGSGQRRRGG